MKNARRHLGLSLVGMLVVVGIIALIASVAVTLTLRMTNQAKERDLASIFALLKTACRSTARRPASFLCRPNESLPMRRLTCNCCTSGSWPSRPRARVLTQLAGLSSGNDTTGREVGRVLDPWGTVLDYQYGPDDDLPELISAGPDRQFGTEDDISSRAG